MHVSLGTDQAGRLTCAIAEGSAGAVVTSSDSPAAVADLVAAIEKLSTAELSECYWREAGGDYRWVFRRIDNGRVRIAVLWSTGTLTGWEHIFWSECDLTAFRNAITAPLAG